jgi:hypothetical protein
MTRRSKKKSAAAEATHEAALVQYSGDNPLAPPARVLCKIGSIITHVEEAVSNGGHVFDLIALQALLVDPEVQRWLGAMGSRALIPLKRKRE